MTDAKTIHCKLLKKDLPALAKPPYKNDLGEKIFGDFSQEAWGMWKEHAKILLNEYRLNLAMVEAQEFLMKQCHAFFYEGGAQQKLDYTPETAEANAQATGQSPSLGPNG